MGGLGSGDWQRLDARRKTDAYLQLRISSLTAVMEFDSEGEQLAVVTCDNVSTRVTWSFTFRSAFLSIERSAHVKGGARSDTNWSVELLATDCNFGGKRFWFQCPKCWRRAQVLYLVDDDWRCRLCGHLRYPSQSEGKIDQLLRKQARIRRQLKLPYGVHRKTIAKPKGMHYETYWRLTLEDIKVRSRIICHLKSLLKTPEN